MEYNNVMLCRVYKHFDDDSNDQDNYDNIYNDYDDYDSYDSYDSYDNYNDYDDYDDNNYALCTFSTCYLPLKRTIAPSYHNHYFCSTYCYY